MNSAVFSDTIITVNAIAYEGYEFTGWSTSQGDFPKSDNPLSIIINENTTIQAKFSQPEFLPNVNSQSNGILLSWENFAWSQFSLTLMDNEDYLFYGGLGENSAMVDYQAFDLAGTETLRGRFTEYDSQSGEFIKEYAWFEIDLVSYRTNKIETTDLGDGWKNSNWLGVMFPVSNGWSFHMQLGWIFPNIQGENNVWIYDDVFGWYWTGAEFFPFIFIEDAQVWYFLDMDSTQINLRKYYDYNVEEWIQLATGKL
jgi:hypothetical protein